ncbi:MAG TPA: NAD(P)-dependent oxidoreductase [Stellaceae bacterium]|nr:NAD(P)-dependent oxidoreductase [Stellaceae bacterium]
MLLGFIGTGTMGGAMARCLIEAGHRLTVFDRRSAATEPLAAKGARIADSPAAVALESEIVFASLPGPKEVESAVLDPTTGLLTGLRGGGVFVDMTTNSPEVARRLSAACRARGIAMLDAPVSGRPPAMTVMAGGDAATFERCRPIFAAMAGNVFFLGEAGTGCTAKLVTQYLGYTNFIAAIEGMLIGAKAGIDLATLAKIVPLSAGASRTFDNIPRAILSGSFVSGGTLDIVAKDMALACELAREVGAPARLGPIADEIYRAAQAAGWGGEGFPVVARVLEKLAGCELRADAPVEAASYAPQDPRR